MKEVNFSAYYQQTYLETLTKRVYCRVVSLIREDESTKYLVEVLFKYTHMYKSVVYDDIDSAVCLYNDVIK